MRSSNHARSAVQSAPLTPSGVLVRLASKRRAIIVPQREAIGPEVRSTTCFTKLPSSAPNASSGKPPEDSEIMPIAPNDLRAAGGTSYRMTNSGSFWSASSSPSVASTVAEGSSVPTEAVGEEVPAGEPGAAGEGLPGLAGGGGGGSPNPSGRRDSGPCWPSAGKENTKTRAPATNRPLFVILSVNGADLFPYLRDTISFVQISRAAHAATESQE